MPACRRYNRPALAHSKIRTTEDRSCQGSCCRCCLPLRPRLPQQQTRAESCAWRGHSIHLRAQNSRDLGPSGALWTWLSHHAIAHRQNGRKPPRCNQHPSPHSTAPAQYPTALSKAYVLHGCVTTSTCQCAAGGGARSKIPHGECKPKKASAEGRDGTKSDQSGFGCEMRIQCHASQCSRHAGGFSIVK